MNRAFLWFDKLKGHGSIENVVAWRLPTIPNEVYDMHINEVRTRAKSVGLNGIGKMRKADIILQIQREENHTPCFGSDQRKACPYNDCCWREDCQRI